MPVRVRDAGAAGDLNGWECACCLSSWEGKVHMGLYRTFASLVCPGAKRTRKEPLDQSQLLSTYTKE